MNKTKNQNGFGVVEGLLIVIIILLVGFIGYYVWHTQKQTNKTLNQASSTASKASSSSSVTSGSTKYFTISQWGVKAPYDGGLSLEYTIENPQSGLPASAALSSTQLDASDPDNCKLDASIGSIYGGVILRYKSTDEYLVGDLGDDSGMTAAQAAAKADTSDYGHVGDYYYFFDPPQGLCSDNSISNDIQSKTTDAVRDLIPKLQVK